MSPNTKIVDLPNLPLRKIFEHVVAPENSGHYSAGLFNFI